jgi:His/Glu/Gln/Arg/opine family amino acid ABC transporter permease subunit
MPYEWHFEIVWQNMPYLLQGLLTTGALTSVAMFFGIFWGLAVALIRIKFTKLTPLLLVYVEIFRATPILVQLLWIYDVLPSFGLRLDPFWSAAVGLVINLGAYLSEVFRAGIISVGRGQIDGALALGMTPTQVFRTVVLPIAARRLLPPLASTWVGLFKDTSLASVIAVPELSYRANVLSVQTYRPLEVLTAIGAIYFLVTYPQARIAYWLSHATRLGE